MINLLILWIIIFIMEYTGEVDEENVFLNKNSQQKSSSIFGIIRNIFPKNNEPGENNFKNKVLDIIEVKQNYTLFFVMIAIGGFFIFLSLLFLPIVLLNPQKFVSLFSLGTLMIILSFNFIYGTKEYFNLLFANRRVLFTLLYFCSIVFGIYFTFVDSWFIISHICTAFQFITLIVFVLSFVPGGDIGIKFIWSSLKSLVVKTN